MLSDNKSAVKFTCRLIVNGQSLISFKWRDVFALLQRTLDIEPDTLRSLISSSNIARSFKDDDEFQVYGIFDSDVDQETKDSIYNKLISFLEDDFVTRNLVLCLSVDYALTKALISALEIRGTKLGQFIRTSPLLAICTSDIFLESKQFNLYAAERMNEIEVPDSSVTNSIHEQWFADIMDYLSGGQNGTNSYTVNRNIQENWKDRDLAGVEKLIYSGQFLGILLHRDNILADTTVRNILRVKAEGDNREKKLNAFYTWLGIANDFSLGVEFLVGSIEFLPYHNTYFGTILFIIGSAQLLARAIISIVHRAHLDSNRKKIRRVM